MTKERRNIFSYIRVLKLYITEQILGNFEPLPLLNKETLRMPLKIGGATKCENHVFFHDRKRLYLLGVMIVHRTQFNVNSVREMSW